MGIISLILLLFYALHVVITDQDYASPQVPQYLKNRYGNQLGARPDNQAPKYSGTKTFTKTKTKSGGYGGYNPDNLNQYQTNYPSYHQSPSELGYHPPVPPSFQPLTVAPTPSKLQGGCSGQPPTPINAGITCSQYSGCRATCRPNYRFPNGATQLIIKCENGQYRIDGYQWDQIPNCEPICDPFCQNNGICIAPNQCNCPETFSGPQCQIENKRCLINPPLSRNSRRICRSNSCTFTCLPGHQFPDGSGMATIICNNGYWVPTKEQWTSVPDCEPTCNPPCEHGGVCLSFNTCQCPQEFRGPQCQYNTDSCSGSRLQFNGGYNCSGDMQYFRCSLSCPEGINFQFLPQPWYTCAYESGIFQPQPLPQCVYPENVQIIPSEGSSQTFFHLMNSSNHFDGGSGSYYPVNFNEAPPTQGRYPPLVTLEEKLPEPGICFTWGGSHYKTFDGKIYSFNSNCSHILIRDAIDNTFSIVVKNSDECYQTYPQQCHRIIKIYYQGKEYILKKSPENGVASFTYGSKILPIPGQLPGLRVGMSAHYIVLSLDTISTKVKWDGQKLVQIEVRESLWNRTEGLCGKLDGDITNDLLTKDEQPPKSLVSLANSWKVDDLENVCNNPPSEEHACPDNRVEGSRSHDAMVFCHTLINDPRFAPCHQIMDVSVLLDACRWDYCSCKQRDPSLCACDTMNVYVRGCSYKGVKNLATWRDDQTCPMICTGGRVYKSCAPPEGQPGCGDSNQVASSDSDDNCVEGCYCPEGTVANRNQCITRDQCPCKLRGKSFPPGSEIPKECNTCTCDNGKWVCTQIPCGARCSAIGDPHYVTFDGRKYDFMGQCSYHLVKTPTFSIEAENVACTGAISQAMNLPISASVGLPSCTKTVTLKIEGNIIKMKQGNELVVNGQDVTELPYQIGNVSVRIVSSIFLQVELPNGIEIWWDGVTRVYVDIPPNFPEKTRGLCGTFNNNQKDDFLTPEDDVEQTVIPFANKWKTSEKCNDIPDVIKNHPCTVNIHNQPVAEKYCQTIRSQLFQECHWLVDPEPFYQDCLFDMCSCDLKVSKCLCPIIASYAAECARKGVKTEWRSDVRECGVQCPAGQQYQICGNSCTRSCFDIAVRSDCKPQCVEGCNCPEGQALDGDGDCVRIGRCKCIQDGLQYHDGYKEVRAAPKGQELCTCVNARWDCKLATSDDVERFPNANDLKSLCSSSDNMEFTTCEPVEPITCKNMQSQDFFAASVCHAGCKCKEGYVIDSTSKTCVKPEQCPCHHGGRSYKENQQVQNDCNTCVCQNGKWKCEDKPCSAECSAWGDSHYKTFDGKTYDFQGQCDYILSKGSLESDSFSVTTQNIPCGSLGISCSKSISIKVHLGKDLESITLTKGEPLKDSTKFKHLAVREKGLFVFVEALDLGVTIQWDKGTRVYVKIDPRWKDKVKGLCGNYNDNDADDFQTPSGGLTEVSAKIFGDSWKLQAYCPEAQEVASPCEERPERKVWAMKKCGILKSSLFAPCHSEVPIDEYLDKCLFDTCACDQGGDCACLCTALAAYAQECNNRGVPIKWRSQQLCPMQCDERCSNYNPCISTCPTETCDNLLTQTKISRSCKEESCVEGCAPLKPCPPDHVYLNSSLFDCVPRNSCKPICFEIDGVIYYEGDLIKEDECHTCYCSRGQEVCKGQPCTTSTPEFMTTIQLEQIVQCHSGWTEWINQDFHPSTKTRPKMSDIEPIPSELIMNNLNGAKCGRDKMINIECRTVGTHWPPKLTGLDVECSLENGLICKSNREGKSCKDFEIRVLCECAPTTTYAPIGEMCDPTIIHQPHPASCHLFYHCQTGLKGVAQLVEKTCGPSMYYNPVTMICDWPYAVIEIRPECKKNESESQEANLIEPEIPQCPPGEVMDPCAIKCDQMCSYYNYVMKKNGFCLNKCESGCVSEDKKLSCPSGMLWANNETCVAIQDCLCRSTDGRPVKPGVVYRESDCKVCQCIDDFYSCDDSACYTTESPKKKPSALLESIATLVPIEFAEFVSTTVTPPQACDPHDFIDLMQGDQPLPDDAFNASSYLNSFFEPKNARFDAVVNSNSGGSWAPSYSNTEQYLEINLGRQEPIYGIKIKGSPLYNEFVTSFKIAYSPDGHYFLPVLNRDKLPQIFRGSIDQSTPVQQLFDPPFEARIVRINPQTWTNGISLRVELIGCGQHSTTPNLDYEMITISPKPRYCEDSMGLSGGSMSVKQQISVSSELNRNHTKSNLDITGADGSYWQPFSNTPTEFVQFDFIEPRNITGFITKGGLDGWVTSFIVKYSHNGKEWNPVIDKSSTAEKVFVGNFDGHTPQTNHFDLPIATRFIKVIPKLWKNVIQLRIEMLGCFEPYPIILEEVVVSEAPSICNRCPGVNPESLELGTCRCEVNLWWDGDGCVNRTECPCMIDHTSNGQMKYVVGAIYKKDDCSVCVCKIGGVSHCTPPQCDSCSEGLRSTVMLSTCKCTCQPCVDGTTLCPTSNICINSTSWCDGVEDCPDDEVDCFVTTTTEIPEKVCQVIECPPGYKTEIRKETKVVLSPMFLNYGGKTTSKGGNKYTAIKTGRGVKKPNPSKEGQNPIGLPVEEEKICPEYRCVSTKPPPLFIHGEQECPPAICPSNYIPVFDIESPESTVAKECPMYTCNPPPPPDSVCNVTGRTFNTFDKTEYKYDICNHILARDSVNGEWQITFKKNCSSETCTRNLIITHLDDTFTIYPDFTVRFNGFKYTLGQIEKIGSESTESFAVSRLGNTLLFVSKHYGFWVMLNLQGSVKLGMVHKLSGKVDGLCGYFNNDPHDDKRKPDGDLARTTDEFGDSWLQPDDGSICETRICPMDTQNKAWEMCNEVKNQILAPCAKVIDIEIFISRCMETTCECLQSFGNNSRTAEEACRCDTLKSFVVDCLTAEPKTDLSDWRTQLDCPVRCDAPLVYHDCYQKRCEPTCQSISDPNICPKLPNVCFPGCYCPQGYVRKGDSCITPSNCRDCECNVLPHLQYVTYDDSNFTVNGDCVYVMSRDVPVNGQHKFQVLITNAPCKTNQQKTCVGKVTVLYQGHKIHILNDFLRNNLRLIIDGERIDDFGEVAQWVGIKQTATRHLKLLLIDLQVEISVYYPSLGVSVKAPSHKYGGKLEGLCGDCDRDKSDDLKLPNGDVTDDVDKFSISWLYDKLPGGQNEEQCRNKLQECPMLSDDQNPCLQIVDANKFGQCLNLLDPSLFVDWCNKDTCGGHPEEACTSIEAYARDCANAGFCMDWRTDLCPAKICSGDQTYNPCGTACPETCESVKTGQSNCRNIPTEGCFCPDGKILLNGTTCVEEKDCEVCDEEGHHPGDEWRKDRCTTCKCEGTTLRCETERCPGVDKICERGYQAVLVPTKQDECCDKYACVPEPTSGPICDPPQKLVCGSGQILKLDTKPNGCQQFICECKPSDECESIDLATDSPLETGYEREIDESGCCPEVNLVCRPELCPPPEKCPQYHKLETLSVPGICCPFHNCEPPHGKCIAETFYKASEVGGERPVREYEKTKSLRDANETWNDGPCRSCKCSKTEIGNYQSTCTKTECPSIHSLQDSAEYLLESEFVIDQCCPNPKRVACKQFDTIYQVGDKWHKDGDSCTTIECTYSISSETIQKETQVKTCDTSCELGYVYVPPNPSDNSDQCCGYCKQHACLVDGSLHQIGEEWEDQDHCRKYFCLNMNGSVQVQSVKVNCPEAPKEYVANFEFELITVPGECCKEYKTTGCKVGNELYAVGESWPSPDGDRCRNITCVRRNDEEIVKQETVETCKSECPRGWKYKESEWECCGECVQTACLVDGELKEAGTNWTTADSCTTYSCDLIGDQFVVSSQQESCPNVDDCPAESLYQNGCCQHCNITSSSHSLCSAEVMPMNLTVGYIEINVPQHGTCTNKGPIDGFTECVGTCSSSTTINKNTGVHQNICTCCRAIKLHPIVVYLECEDGHKWDKSVYMPKECSCEGCSSPTKNPNKTFVKS